MWFWKPCKRGNHFCGGILVIKIALPNKSIVALMAKVLQCNMALLLTHALKCQQLRKSKVVMVTIKVHLKSIVESLMIQCQTCQRFTHSLYSFKPLLQGILRLLSRAVYGVKCEKSSSFRPKIHGLYFREILVFNRCK